MNIPLSHNSLIYGDRYGGFYHIKHFVRINSVIVDGTRPGKFLVIIQLTNFGYYSEEFTIRVASFPMPRGSTNSKRKIISSHQTTTLYFILLTQEYTKSVKFKSIGNLKHLIS